MRLVRYSWYGTVGTVGMAEPVGIDKYQTSISSDPEYVKKDEDFESEVVLYDLWDK